MRDQRPELLAIETLKTMKECVINSPTLDLVKTVMACGSVRARFITTEKLNSGWPAGQSICLLPPSLPSPGNKHECTLTEQSAKDLVPPASDQGCVAPSRSPAEREPNGAAGDEPDDVNQLTAGEQMALYKKDSKENDRGLNRADPP